mmetsp:Transcript_20291/g.64812  ORF Transcript_20291/g.64812 Transcript_20291/m.64812 type:complete len:224 (-) Transcript_20291:2840-3511(-)
MLPNRPCITRCSAPLTRNTCVAGCVPSCSSAAAASRCRPRDVRKSCLKYMPTFSRATTVPPQFRMITRFRDVRNAADASLACRNENCELGPSRCVLGASTASSSPASTSVNCSSTRCVSSMSIMTCFVHAPEERPLRYAKSRPTRPARSAGDMDMASSNVWATWLTWNGLTRKHPFKAWLDAENSDSTSVPGGLGGECTKVYSCAMRFRPSQMGVCSITSPAK